MGSKRTLRSVFVAATELATETLGDIARAIGRTRRMLEFYRSGERRVTPEAARTLAGHLRERAGTLERVATELERAANEEETDG
ncbi:MAG: hypothetical protein ACE5JR_02050 [Gemmatimonadota bacterium]